MIHKSSINIVSGFELCTHIAQEDFVTYSHTRTRTLCLALRNSNEEA